MNLLIRSMCGSIRLKNIRIGFKPRLAFFGLNRRAARSAKPLRFNRSTSNGSDLNRLHEVCGDRSPKKPDLNRSPGDRRGTRSMP